MNTKIIEAVIAPPPTHWVGDGFKVHNFIPGVPGLDMQKMDPIILMDYNAKMKVAGSEHAGGVGVHPHRGFETVTIAYQGKVQHHDSHGGGGIIGQGDVQWMTASSGILHKEYYEKEWAKSGGDFQMVQLWVNLPKEVKMSPPRYQAILRENMGHVVLEDMESFVEIIAGEYKGTKGPALTFSNVQLMNARLKKGAKADFSFPSRFNTAILVIEGSVIVNGNEHVPANYFVKFKNEGEDFSIEAKENALVLVLSGDPIREPIAAYGPFVMNTQEEIRQAFKDFEDGKFGYLED
ncbi:MAG: short-chain dehydrogenase [Bacteroidetes bacterium]|jgi:quercetin 2,3-dioxygenase|nr:short-chain dehydrogenase [Bacteroidota bacterium]